MSKPKGPRQWNSTLPATPKRPRVAKKAPARGINRTTTQRKGVKARKELPKSNPERQAKRRKAYAVKLAAYKRSETYRIVEARAAGRCERICSAGPEIVREFTGVARTEYWRCEASRVAGDRLSHNHLSYARLGGNELPKDIEVLCDRHNELYESQHSTRNRNYR